MNDNTKAHTVPDCDLFLQLFKLLPKEEQDDLIQKMKVSVGEV